MPFVLFAPAAVAAFNRDNAARPEGEHIRHVRAFRATRQIAPRVCHF